MKKWQIATIISLGLIFIVAGSGALYWYISQESGEKAKVQVVERTAEEKDLEGINEDIETADAMDLTELDEVTADLETVDLAGL